jgi:dihydrofolate synthase/folylpolyglutamate synthase
VQRDAPFFLPHQLSHLSSSVNLAPFQRENLAVAAAVCEQCGIPTDLTTFVPPQIPGRLQALQHAPPIVIDAAHNADSARRLVEALRLRYPHTEFTCVLGLVAGKDAEGVLDELAKLTRSFIFTHPRLDFKGSELERLGQLGEKMGLDCRSIPIIHTTDDLPKGVPLLFTGSFFTACIGAELFADARLGPRVQ